MADRRPFGVTRRGEAVELVTLRSAARGEARILTYGAALQGWTVPDRNGRLADVVLGYPDLVQYESNPGYFGATVGRVANRIAGGTFTLGGETHQIPCNYRGSSALHGGPDGFDKRVWRIVGAAEDRVELALTSPDGDQGFPGAIEVLAEYRLDPLGRLAITYTATCDRPTVINLTNHALYNMAGEGAPTAATANELTIYADAYLPVDQDLIPLGEFQPVAGTPFDFRAARVVDTFVSAAGDEQIRLARGYDHCFALRGGETSSSRLVARLEDRASGRAIDIYSNQAGLQLYSGNNLNGSAIGKRGVLYRRGDGVALEPQRFPDAVNRPEFGLARLAPGERYQNILVLAPRSST